MFQLILLSIGLFSFNLNAAETSSNITLHNTSGSAVSVRGFYIQKFASGGSCTNISYGSFPSAKRSYGSIWRTHSVDAGSSKSLGANTLYQMLSQATYVYTINSLGGANCTPGVGQCDAGNAPNTNQWCINLGLSKGTPKGGGELIDDADDLLPLLSSLEIKISCDDTTATCVADTPTTQDF
jgi:hypothetical protein